MTIYYRIVENEIEIIRCYGIDSKVIIPEQIGGFPVTMIAPYAFSDWKREEETNILIYENETDGLFIDQLHLLAGPYVEEIDFPDTVRKIGNYVFYGCKNLQVISASNLLTQIGSGAFTGCGMINRLNINMCSGNRSCVKEILEDLWQRIDVTFVYREEKKEVKVVFPEHYEEAVENTPARILFTQHHGSGNDYRQCFYDRKLDYQKYDNLFVVAAARDNIEVLTDIVFARLMYPKDLSDKSREKYVDFIKQNYKGAITCILQQDGMAHWKTMTKYSAWTKESIDYAIEVAAMCNKADVTGYLMNEKQKSFQSKRKKFSL